jgi:hypothetical protein
VAVSLAAPPLHTVSVKGVIAATGPGFIVTSAVAEPVQVPPSLTVTVYVVATVGVEVIKRVVAPVLHIYVLPEVATKVSVLPGQTEGWGGAIVTTRARFTVTVALAVAVHPSAPVTVKV